MGPRVISGAAVWPACVDLSRRPGRRFGAIAYVSITGADLLASWGEGDVIVCNASDAALRSGSTSPKALRRLRERGVDVRSHKGLHAKVLIVGSEAIVGSMNASTSSAGRLLEAAVVLQDKKSVEQARDFVRDVMADSVHVDKTFLTAADLTYRPPRFLGGGESGGSEDDPPDRPPVRLRTARWLKGEAPPSVQETIEANELTIELDPPSRYRIDNSWDRARWARKGDWVLWVQDDFTLAPQECVLVKKAAGRSSQWVSFWREDRTCRSKRWSREVLPELRAHGWGGQLGDTVTGGPAAAAAFELWDLQYPPED